MFLLGCGLCLNYFFLFLQISKHRANKKTKLKRLGKVQAKKPKKLDQRKYKIPPPPKCTLNKNVKERLQKLTGQALIIEKGIGLEDLRTTSITEMYMKEDSLHIPRLHQLTVL